MPAYSKEREQLFISRIRSLIVRRQDLTIQDLTELLEQHPHYPIKLNRNYVAKLVKKIQGEQARRLDRVSVNTALASFQDEIMELKQRMWAIVSDTGEKDDKGKYIRYPASNKDKIAATKAIIDSSAELLDKMFDAGIFTRNLGRVEVGLAEDKKKQIDKIFELNSNGTYEETKSTN